jgi:hypothetical protein
MAGHVAVVGGERRHGEKQRGRREGDDGDGKLVNNSKFQSSVSKFNFSPCSRGQTKNF